MSIVDKNPRLKLMADINRIARENGVINDLGLALRGLYRESVEPTIKEKIEAKLKVLRERLGDEKVASLAAQAAAL